MLSGDNGILQKATDAKTKNDEAQIRERIQLAYNSALTKDITGENGELTMTTLQGELDNEFTGKTVTITPSADNKKWTIKVDNVEETVPAGKRILTSKLTDDEKTALQTNGIAEIIGDAITNENLKDTTKIRVVLEGEVPITTEMTYVTGTKDTGVVVAINENEFVWVPVPVAIASSAPAITGVDVSANPSTERPMAILQSGSTTNYQGILYNFSETTSTYDPTFTLGTNHPREPALLSGMEDNSSYISYVSGQGITAAIPSASELQTEYNSIVMSVNKYKGFYVARYELGLDSSNKPVSKPATTSSGITTADASQTATKSWYGLYDKIKTMYPSSGSGNITSTMIWGSQYDAMMNWMAKTGKDIGNSNSTAWGSNHTATGTKSSDIINNVYDLYGGHL